MTQFHLWKGTLRHETREFIDCVNVICLTFTKFRRKRTNFVNKLLFMFYQIELHNIFEHIQQRQRHRIEFPKEKQRILLRCFTVVAAQNSTCVSCLQLSVWRVARQCHWSFNDCMRTIFSQSDIKIIFHFILIWSR